MNPGDLSKLLNQRRNNPTVPFTRDMSPEGFFRSWINSPEYKRRLQQNQYSNPDRMISNRNAALDNLVFEFRDDLETQASPPATPGSQAYININPLSRRANIDTQTAHELSHVTGAKPQAVNRNIGFNPTEEEMIRGFRTNPSKHAHERMPEEMKADLDATRFNLFKKGLYDITSGNPFTKEDLDRALPSLQEDTSFRRLFDQTGEESFINMMNTIAMNRQNNNMVAAYGGLINPIQEEYSLGGFLGGAARGAKMGAKLGSFLPGKGNIIGAIGGGLIGGIGSFFSNRNRPVEPDPQEEHMVNQNIQSSLGSMMMSNNSNIPMAYGGKKNYEIGGTMNPLTEFNTGGTHESNPLGGIPQGYNEQGQMRTVEEGETKFRFKDGDYIFSNRLTL